MAGKIYIVEGRQFKVESDYKLALRDQELIEKLRLQMKGAGINDWKKLRDDIEGRRIVFQTMLGDDFLDEVYDQIKKLERQAAGKTTEKRKVAEKQKSTDAQKASSGKSRASVRRPKQSDPDIEEAAKKILRQKERNRRIILIACAALAVCGLGFFIANSIIDYQKSMSYQMLNNIREHSAQKNGGDSTNGPVVGHGYTINYTDDKKTAEVLPEFKEMLAVNSKLIGWVSIEGTNIDYPVAQTVDNSYYLDHDLNQNYDRNGTIFLDTNCDVLKPSTNFILYGHHMQSGNMFGNLGKFENKDYWEKHKYITFDTIYEYGTWEIMYVFRSHVYNETEVAFKYYQFYDAYSEIEFDSYMQEMAAVSLYDTGVTAEYGDRLLTLSTCDYQEKNGRFVVVAKKIK